MNNLTAPAPERAQRFRLFDVVTFAPACNCPPAWRALVEHLQGQEFQIAGRAELPIGRALVLQPYPCQEPFPGYQLAPVDCVRLGASVIERFPGLDAQEVD
jgi:hypothetical protein